MLTGFDGGQHQILGHGIATDQLHHDVDGRITHHGEGIGTDAGLVTHHLTGTPLVLVCHHGDFNATTGATGDFFLIA